MENENSSITIILIAMKIKGPWQSFIIHLDFIRIFPIVIEFDFIPTHILFPLCVLSYISVLSLLIFRDLVFVNYN